MSDGNQEWLYDESDIHAGALGLCATAYELLGNLRSCKYVYQLDRWLSTLKNEDIASALRAAIRAGAQVQKLLQDFPDESPSYFHLTLAQQSEQAELRLLARSIPHVVAEEAGADIILLDTFCEILFAVMNADGFDDSNLSREQGRKRARMEYCRQLHLVQGVLKH